MKKNNMKKKIKEKRFTEFEEMLIMVIDNFILWNTTETDIKLAEEYIENEHVDYNDWLVDFLKERINR